MLHCNRFQLELNNQDDCYVRYECTETFEAGHNIPQYYAQAPSILNNRNCILNQHENIQKWIKGCQVLGFIPDNPTSEFYPTTESCRDWDYQNQQTYKSNPHECFSNKSRHDTLKVNLKRKRKRTCFTTEQIVLLEGVFQWKPYITKDERVDLTKRLHLSEKAIKIWFQNRRRIPDKKCQEYASDSPSSIDTQDSFSERLSLIETYIKENTDENGYVTLNDHIMSELVGVIDEYLSKDIQMDGCDSEATLNSTISEDVIMYEPISPASTDYSII